MEYTSLRRFKKNEGGLAHRTVFFTTDSGIFSKGGRESLDVLCTTEHNGEGKLELTGAFMLSQINSNHVEMAKKTGQPIDSLRSYVMGRDNNGKPIMGRPTVCSHKGKYFSVTPIIEENLSKYQLKK